MPPLILHHVPDDELYTGDDGVQRPFAMLFANNNESNNPITRSRRAVHETGSFGKSTRRSRSRAGNPAAKKEDPTLTAADAIFSHFIAQKAAENSDLPQRPPSILVPGSQTSLMSTSAVQNDGTGLLSKFPKHRMKEPTEVILRGFNSSQQYAAIREYERIAGRICEDYPRDPPIEQRKYKVDSGDPASLRLKPLTSEEKAKVYKFAGGNHWIKVTFESAETAEAAIECSPQKILGHLVFAELYRGIPPIDEEILANSSLEDFRCQTYGVSLKSGLKTDSQAQYSKRSNNLEQPILSSFIGDSNHGPSLSSQLDLKDFAPITESISSNSSEKSTACSGSKSSNTTGDYCQRIPTARRLKLLPAEEALLPQQSPIQKFIGGLPFIGWVSRDIIGGAIPRTELGEFDYSRASLYWRLVWVIERITGIALLGDPKDD